jgi:methionyl-tRNA formyltransferase
MKLIYLATSSIAVETLLALIKKHEVVAVVTAPDKPQGRSARPVCSPVCQAGMNAGIKIFKPEKIDADLIEELKQLNIDLFISFSYGVILKENFFCVSKMGGINIHPSLLPDLRGPSPIKTAIMLGYEKSGITIQKMKLKVDSGDILYQVEFNIDKDDDAITLEKKVSRLSSEIINDFLDKFEKGEIAAKPQDDNKATYCKLIKKDQGKINWDEKGKDIINKIRAFIDWPTAYSFLDNNRVNIYKAVVNDSLNFDLYKSLPNGKVVFADKKNGLVIKTNDCLINILTLQLKGKKVLDWKDFINGYRNLNLKIFSNGEIDGTF